MMRFLFFSALKIKKALAISRFDSLWILILLSGVWLQDWQCIWLKEHYSLHHMNLSRGYYLWRFPNWVICQSSTNNALKTIQWYWIHLSQLRHDLHWKNVERCGLVASSWLTRTASQLSILLRSCVCDTGWVRQHDRQDFS